jgi:hypothetical protein
VEQNPLRSLVDEQLARRQPELFDLQSAAADKPNGLLSLAKSAPDLVNRASILPLVEYSDGSAGVGLPKALAVPLNAAIGIYNDPSNPSAVGRAAEVGLALAGGGLAVGQGLKMAPKGSVGVFGGRVPRGGFEVDYFGTPVQVLRNPGQQQLASYIRGTKFKAARQIVDPETGDKYIWDAADPALHQMMAERIGVKFDPKAAVMLAVD